MEHARDVIRKLAAILHADVQGYSRLIGQDERTTLRTVASHLDLMRTLVGQHGGRVVGSRGDSLLAEFPSVVERSEERRVGKEGSGRGVRRVDRKENRGRQDGLRARRAGTGGRTGWTT